MIPRLIHQIYLSGHPPEPLARNIAAIKATNPGWRHILYDNAAAEEFIAKHYDADHLAAYRAINPIYGAARADLLRQLIIFRLGGVYLDIKSFTARPLDDVLRPNDVYILSQWNDNGPGEARQGYGHHRALRRIVGGEYQTFHIIAAPDHPFSRAVIEAVVHNIRRYAAWSPVGKRGVLHVTGPVAYTLAIEPIRDHHPHRMVDYRNLGLEPSIPYDHRAVFKQHYTTQTAPLVTLPPVAAFANRVVNGVVRSVGNLKARIRT